MRSSLHLIDLVYYYKPACTIHRYLVEQEILLIRIIYTHHDRPDHSTWGCSFNSLRLPLYRSLQLIPLSLALAVRIQTGRDDDGQVIYVSAQNKPPIS